MAFSFFGKRKPADSEGTADGPVDEVPADEDFEEGVPEDDGGAAVLDAEWLTRAAAVLPGGASTGSKRPAALYGPDGHGPAHFIRASGCHVVTAGDHTLIDCTMALGAVSLGYGDDGVTRQVIAAIAAGNVAGLSHVSEVEVAERLCEVIPCAERVRFVKTGAEGVAAAVRLARVATGRDHVVTCGYFGWHDWSNVGDGIPAVVSGLVTQVPFNDVAALESAVQRAGRSLAAVVLEPVIEALPDAAWIARARALCDDAGAVLVFDEMKTGFRLALGGYQEHASVTPDLAVFGKAMANGHPIAAVVGRAAVMDAAERTWISSTHAGEAGALAAVHGVLDRYMDPEQDVCGTLWRVGAHLRESVSNAIAASGIPGVTVRGIDPMWFTRFEDAAIETRFLMRAAAHGVLFKRGAYNYAALAHDDEHTLLEIERVASTALVEVMEHS